jgi:acyl dehydratase
MALDLSCVGLTTEPTRHSYAWKDVALYALAVGATRDELDFVYEGRGPKVLPSFAVIPAWAALMQAMARAGITFDKVVHGHQKVSVKTPLAPAATLLTTARVEAIYDMKKMAQVVVRTESRDEGGAHRFDTEWGIIVLGWGGEPPPAREGSAPTRPADFRVEAKTSPEQALLYRLTGDDNPLHADPDFALVKDRFGGKPILHGLCTYGYMTRAVAQAVCGGDATRIRHLSARFTKPVWPGDTLVTEGWVDGAAVRLRTTTLERGEAVLSHCSAEIDP